MRNAQSDWPPKQLAAPYNPPSSNEDVHPWIQNLLASDVEQATVQVNQRLEGSCQELGPLIKALREFVPTQCAFSQTRVPGSDSEGRVVGHVRLVRYRVGTQPDEDGWRAVYLAQPLTNADIDLRVLYFEESLRPLMREFYMRFVGFGDEVTGVSGQFLWDNESFENWNWIATQEVESWITAKVLYVASDGDAILIGPTGKTAWHVFSENEIIPIAETFPEFIELYARFLDETDSLLDAYSWRQFYRH